MKHIHCIIFLAVFGFLLVSQNEAYAQSSRDSEDKVKTKTSSKVFLSKKKVSKKAFHKDHDQGIKEYEALMKENKKKYKKMSKGMEKPQYSDPSYFGHKKKPKKRKLGKRKLCEECGIVH